MSFGIPRVIMVSLTAVSVLAACGPSRGPLDGGYDAGFICVGNCGGGGGGPDGGQDGGQGDGGTASDGGLRTVTVAQARQATFCTDNIRIEGAVVVAIESSFKGTQGDYNAQFWVVDPANPQNGIFVEKRFQDLPGPYEPQIGDVLDLEGYLSSRSRYEDRTGYRITLKGQAGCAQPSSGKLVITKKGTTVPPVDNPAPAGFGNADGGFVQANRELVGTRVHIPGPLALTDPNPRAFQRVSANPTDTVYFGFEVTGGILINNYKTFGTTFDGGTPRCDWRAAANDGGTVTFPDGIRGVWDSYSHAPCYDGGTASGSNCLRDAGHIPGTDRNYTFVLYPQDCAVDFANAVVQ